MALIQLTSDMTVSEQREAANANFNYENGLVTFPESAAGNIARLKSGGGVEDAGFSYETGTWTPGLFINGSTIAVTSAEGWYVKLGKIVICDILITIPVISPVSSGWNGINGLPFERGHYQAVSQFSNNTQCWFGQFVSATTVLFVDTVGHVSSDKLSEKSIVGTIVYETGS